MNPFIGQSQETLEAWLREAQEDLAAGKTITSAGAGDTRFDNQVSGSPEKRIEQLLRALNLLDPVTYPATEIRRATRTRIEVFPNF